MSINRHTTTMCNVCGKVMQDENLKKKHKSKKHGEISQIVLNVDRSQQSDNLTVDVQHKDIENDTSL